MDSTARDIWKRALEHLREELPPRTIKNWFRDVVAHELDESVDPPILVLQVPTPYQREFVRDRHWNTLQAAIDRARKEPTNFRLEVNQKLDSAANESEPTERSDTAPAGETSSRGQSTRPLHPEKRGAAKRARQPHHSRTASSQGVSVPAKGRQHPVEHSSSARSKQRPARQNPFHRSRVREILRDDYTFDQFVEGDSNSLARSAATAVAKDPGGTQYNPLFVYGGVGLGKTHLAQAIANHAVRANTAEYVCYISSEQFTNEFVKAIREGDGNQFAQKYRSVDLLIVDDVQFFGGKEKTQEEFFHLFNDLHQQGKQIVLCADRASKEIEGIEERLLSRFQWGLSADIQRPDFETRLAILHLKAEALSLDIQKEVLELMAENITTNIRQLEGALRQLSARAELTEATIDIATAREFLADHVEIRDPVRIQPEDIMDGVAEFYGLSRDELVDRSRRQELVRARHIAMYFCRGLTELSFEAIGLRFAGRDHSTVVHACNRIEDALDVEDGFESELARVRKAIRRRV